MSDLSNYIDFSVQFDLTGDKPVVVLTDTGNYPSGVSALVKGNFLITQPDMGTLGKMTFDDPNIEYTDGALTTYKYSPRAACDGVIQSGTWSITYTVKATGYDNTTMKKTFYVGYAAPKMSIEADFDVFTPLLQYKDTTDYTLSGFSSSVSRSWKVVADTANFSLTGVNQIMSLQNSGNYFDSAYLATLNSTITWTSTKYDWLTIKSKLTVNSTDYANTPPSCSDLMTQLSDYSISCGCNTDKGYVTASMLLNTINKAMADESYDGLYGNIVRYEKIVLGSYNPVNTGAVINAFVYDCGSVVKVSTASTAVIGGDVISFEVGDDGYPIDGSLTFTSAKLYKKTILVFSKGNIELNPTNGDFTYNPDNGNNEGVVTVENAFRTGESVVISLVSVSTKGAAVGGGIATAKIEYDAFDSDPGTDYDSLTFDHSNTVTSDNDYALDTTMFSGKFYFVIKEPKTEAAKTRFYNTDINQGDIPGVSWNDPVISGSYRYYISKNIALDISNTLSMFII